MFQTGRLRSPVAHAAAFCFTLVAQTVLAADPTVDSFLALQSRYPGVRTLRTYDGERAVYRGPMGEGATAEKAAATWLRDHFAVLGDGRTELREVFHNPIAGGRLTAFSYQQSMAGLPVEDAVARLVVHAGRRNQLVYAGGRLAHAPDGGWAPITLTADDAVASVRTLPAYSRLTRWSNPSLAVLVPEGDFSTQTPVRVWKFQGWRPAPDDFAAYTFFVDAATGGLSHVRDEVYAIDVNGNVRGFATPGLLPDIASNPPVLTDLAELTVHGVAGQTADTTDDGDFVLPNIGATEISVDAFLEGPWVSVQNVAGSSLFLSDVVTPPGPADFVFNTPATEFNTSQVNCFIQTNEVHDFYKHYQPGFTGLDVQIDCNVNTSNTCNAFFSAVGPSLNFFAAGAGCVNTAYSSVIHHEYGHFIVSRHGLTQGAFGEGYSDSLAMLLNNDPIIGRDFMGVGHPVRDIPAADQQYPCFGEEHACGQVLGGVWWDLKLNLDAKFGPSEGLEHARQLLTDWTEITVGVRGRNSATPLTAVEVLTADDDDGDLGNGTPNQAEICAAFDSHGIACPGSCADADLVRVTCRRGTFTVRATASTGFSAGSEITLVLDGTQTQAASVSRFGRASVRFSGASEGSHTVCLEGCEDVCQTVSCTP